MELPVEGGGDLDYILILGMRLQEDGNGNGMDDV
jgi:hypothetical protein